MITNVSVNYYSLKVSVPRLIPERKCRNVEKEICNTQMINPHDIKQPVFIKYCTRPEKLTKASYLPPPPANRYSSSPVQANYNSNTQSSRQSTFTPLPPSSSRLAKVMLFSTFKSLMQNYCHIHLSIRSNIYPLDIF